jgi:hypothetical protein
MTLYDVRDNPVTADIMRSLNAGAYHDDRSAHHCCPNCNALYQVVKVEAGPQTAYRAITCRACGAPLPPREASLSSSIFCFARADALSIGDDESGPPIEASWQSRQSVRWIVGSTAVGQRHSWTKPAASRPPGG